jgi:hypothetical protein
LREGLAVKSRHRSIEVLEGKEGIVAGKKIDPDARIGRLEERISEVEERLDALEELLEESGELSERDLAFENGEDKAERKPDQDEE